MNVPDHGAVAGLVVFKEGLELSTLSDRCATQAESLGDIFEVWSAENCVPVGQTVGPELVNLGAVRSVVAADDQQLDAMTSKGLQFLDVHEKATVALEQHHASIPASDRDTKRVRQRVPDSTEVAHMMVPRWIVASHRRMEERLVAGSANDVVVLRDHTLEFF